MVCYDCEKEEEIRRKNERKREKEKEGEEEREVEREGERVKVCGRERVRETRTEKETVA